MKYDDRYPVEKRDKVVFLDIDGPIISTGLFYVDSRCSFDRTVCNGNAIGWVIATLQAANAWLVTNTTHNVHDVEDPLTAKKRTIKDDLIRWGIEPHWFHPNSMTTYPYPPWEKPDWYEDEVRPWGFKHRRAKAVEIWLHENGPDFKWVAFDDDEFSKTNQVLIDFDKGVDVKAFEKACSILGVQANRKFIL